MRDMIIERTLRGKLIAIVRGMDENAILPLAEALYKGGITMIEVTFNQANPATFSATTGGIAGIAKRFGDDVLAGAGTVLTPEQAVMARDAGARYIISPNVDASVIAKTREMGLVSMPGAMTPTEAQAAHLAGADFIKLFPAGNFGPDYIKAVRAPLSHLKYLAVGGINEQNIPAFIKAGAEGFGVGGNLVNKAWIDAGEFDKITSLAKKYVEAVNTAN